MKNSRVLWHKGNYPDYVVEPIISSLKMASAVTLSGSQVGNTLPLPHSKGGAFPFLLTSMGTPLLPADIRSEINGSTVRLAPAHISDTLAWGF